MRRFSRRNQLVTLSDLNVTPLLDLAFVLLIIFIIISPTLQRQEHGIPLTLPRGGAPDRKFELNDLLVVSITQQGTYVVGRQPMSLEQVQHLMRTGAQANPNLVVMLRGDGQTAYENVAAVVDVCQTYGIKCNLRTDPAGGAP